MIDVPTLQSSGFTFTDGLVLLGVVGVIVISGLSTGVVSKAFEIATSPRQRVVASGSLALPVCIFSLIFPIGNNYSSTTHQRAAEVDKVNDTIASSITTDYRVTDVRSKLDLEQARLAVKSDPTRAPEVTIVTAENEKRDVAVLLNPEDGEVTLFSVDDDIDIAALTKSSPTR